MNKSLGLLQYVNGWALIIVMTIVVCCLSATIVASSDSSEQARLVVKAESTTERGTASATELTSSDTLRIDPEQEVLLFLEAPAGQPIAATESNISLTPSDSFEYQPVAEKPGVIKIKCKFDYTVSEISTRLRLTYTLPTGTALASDRFRLAIKPNATATITIDGKGVDNGQSVFITEETEKPFTIEAKSLNGDQPLPGLSLAADTNNIVQVKPSSLLGVKGIGDRKTNIGLRTNNREIKGFSFSVTTLAKAESTAIDNLPTRVDEGQRISIKPQIKSKEGATLTVNSARSIDLEAIGDNKDLVTIEHSGNDFTITVGLLKNNMQSALISIQPWINQDGIDPSNNNRKKSGQPFTLPVEARLGYITFSPPPMGFLFPNGSVTTMAQVRDRSGTPQTNLVKFTVENDAENGRWVIVAQEGNQLTVFWNDPAEAEIKDANGNIKKRPSQVVILANTYLEGRPVVGKVFIRMGEVAKFAPLKIKLNIMDQRTARDLYGGVTSDEYYVLTIRLLNNLKDEDTKQFLGSSILAYSGSIEVAVALEKKFNSKLDSGRTPTVSKEKAKDLATKRATGIDTVSQQQFDQDKNAIESYQKEINYAVEQQRTAEATAAKLEREFSDVKIRNALGKATTDELKNAEKAAELARRAADLELDRLIGLQSQIANSAEARAYAFKQLIEYGDWGLPVDDGKWHPMRRGDFFRIASNFKSQSLTEPRILSEFKPDDEPLCTGVVKYRPFTFEMMVNTVDRRDERGIRSRIFQLLNGLGTAASFFTAVLQPPKSNSTQLVLEKYSNLLLPALDQLFPSLKEQQRQNIVSQAMKPIEEIPFGSDITRVLFIPKKEIRGLLSGHDVRISEVCPFYFSIEVAIVKKGGVVQQGTAIP